MKRGTYMRSPGITYRLLSRRERTEMGEMLAEILLDILPEEIRRSGQGREFFEERMLRDWFHDMTDDEKVLVRSLTKAILDRAFPA
jgi:hypothetical protein